MSPIHTESAFGDAIVAAMVECGWREARPQDYRADLGLDTNELFTFIGATQPDEWNELLTVYGGDPNEAQRGFAGRLDQAIATNGLLDVLRNGVKDRGVLLRVAYFKPNLVAHDSVLDGYRANRLTVVRELVYATKQADWGNKLDLALFLNGIPVATAELKNPLTKQGVAKAKEQYRTDRDPTELIFTRRVVANFAVDPDLVFVATQLKGKNTRFLPFNTGSNGPGQPGGAGNPDPTAFGTYATSYLWEQVWQPDNWLDLLQRFVHLYKSKSPGGGTTKTMVFPGSSSGTRSRSSPRTPQRTARATTTWSWPRQARASRTPSAGSRTASATCTPRPTPANSTPRPWPRASSRACRSSTRSSSSPTAATWTPNSGKRSATSSRPQASS